MVTKTHRPRQALAIVVLTAALLALAQAAALPIAAPAQSLITIQLPEEGKAVAVNPLSGLGYVGMTDDIGVFNLDGYEYLSAIQLYAGDGYAIMPVAVNPCTNKLYTGSKVVDLATSTFVSLAAGGDDIAINPQTNIIYFGYHTVYQGKPDLVVVVDGTANRKVATIEMGYSWYFERVMVAVNPVTNRVYATYSGDDHLHAIDGASNMEITKVPIANIGRVAVNPGTNRVYVVSGTRTVVLDGSTLAELGHIDNSSGYLLVNPFTNRIYSLNVDLKVVDGSTNQVLKTVNLPGGANRPALDPLRGRVYLACAYAGWRDKLMVFQDMPAPPEAELPCPVLWPVCLPVMLKAGP